MSKLQDAPGYDKFVMSFADKIAKQLDAEKLEKEGLALPKKDHEHDFEISEDDDIVSCRTCDKVWTIVGYES